MNTNAYDKAEVLRSLEGLVDVYLPDLKYMDSALAARFSDAADYPEIAAAALREMYRQKGSYLMLDADGLRGVGADHPPPGAARASREQQALPALHRRGAFALRPRLAAGAVPADAGSRRRSGLRPAARPEEYAEVVAELERLGFYRGWTQELTSAGHYAPDFAQAHPFEQS